MSDIICLFSG